MSIIRRSLSEPNLHTFNFLQGLGEASRPRSSMDTERTVSKIASIINFPLRYVGSKTWSLPGLIIHIPVNIYRWLTGKPNIHDSYHQRMNHIDTPQDLTPYLRYVAVCTAGHSIDDTWIEGFDNDTLRFRELSSLGIDVGGLEIYRDKAFIDLGTGLKVTVAESENEWIITFGALGCFDGVVWDREGGTDLIAEGTTPELIAEKQRIMDAQSRMTTSQKKLVASNLLGGQPRAYEQAAEIVAQLKERLPNGKRLTLAGQCFGGSLATYAALKTGTPARCFNTLPLGAGLQHALGTEALSTADSLIEHLSTKTDWISDNQYVTPFDHFLTYVLGICTPGNFGQRFSIESAYRDRHGTHGYILGSVLKRLMPDYVDPETGLDATRVKPAVFLRQQQRAQGFRPIG